MTKSVGAVHVIADLDELRERCAALLCAATAHTLIVGCAAARVHRLWLPPWADEHGVELASYTPDRRPPGMNRVKREAVRSHRRRIEASDVVLVDGLAATSIALTWRDLAVRLPLADLVAAGDSALRAGATVDELVDACRRMRGRRGAKLAGVALPMLDARSRSRPESHLRAALVDAGLTMFESNVAVHNHVGEWVAEPDLSCREARIALEYQGADHATLARMRKDLTRSADLRRAGWLVLMYGPAEVFARPWQIAPEVRQLILQRAPQLLAGGASRRRAL